MKIKRKKLVVKDGKTGTVLLKPSPIKGVEPIWDLYRDGVTQGLLANFLLCPEKARLASVEGLSMIRTGGALAFGSLVHDVLDEVYSSAMRKKDAKDWTKFNLAVLDVALRNKEKQDRDAINSKDKGSDVEALQMLEENFGMAEGILPGYLEKWKEDFEGAEWIALEQTFATEITFELDGEMITLVVRGKRDGVFRSKKSHQLWLFETKTKGRVDEDSIMDRLMFDLQVMLYLWSLWKDYGVVPGGVVYNIIRKPQLRQKKTETLKEFIDRIKADVKTRPDFYYMRYQSSIVESDLKKWEEEFVDILRQLVRWYRKEFHWKNSSACSMGGVNCQFLSVCSRNDRSQFKVKTTAFPELVEKEEE